MKRDSGCKGIMGVFLDILVACFCFGCMPAASLEEAKEEYRAVLSGEVSLWYVGGGEDQLVKVEEIPSIFSPDSDYAAIWWFAAVDLEGDGEAEVILQVIDVAGDMGGYMVLHREDGAIHGYAASYRDFECLKVDGTYSRSSLAGDILEVCRVHFDGESCLAIPFVRCCTEDNWETASYFVDEQPVSEEKYYAAMEGQNAKQPAEWYPFNEENIRIVFA